MITTLMGYSFRLILQTRAVYQRIASAVQKKYRRLTIKYFYVYVQCVNKNAGIKRLSTCLSLGHLLGSNLYIL